MPLLIEDESEHVEHGNNNNQHTHKIYSKGNIYNEVVPIASQMRIFVNVFFFFNKEFFSNLSLLLYRFREFG